MNNFGPPQVYGSPFHLLQREQHCGIFSILHVSKPLLVSNCIKSCETLTNCRSHYKLSHQLTIIVFHLIHPRAYHNHKGQIQ